MSAKDRIRRSPFEFMTTGMKVLAALVIALTLVVSGLLIGIAVYAENGGAPIVTRQEPVHFEPDDIMAPEGTEQIDDEGNPLASGLDSAMAEGGGVPLYVLVGAGIVVVGLYFGMSTRKLNANISEMKDAMR